jgi:hypothetical protein
MVRPSANCRIVSSYISREKQWYKENGERLKKFFGFWAILMMLACFAQIFATKKNRASLHAGKDSCRGVNLERTKSFEKL